MWYWSCRASATLFLKLSSDVQNYRSQIMVLWWEKTQKRKILWPRPKECTYHVSTLLMERSSLRYFFFLKLELLCRKIHCFVWYILKKLFNTFSQSAVNARRQGDENPKSNVFAETMKLLAKNSYGYQIMDRSQ